MADRLRLRRHLCHYCGIRGGVTIDHIVPRCFGGPDVIWNLVSACEPCNREKGSKWPTCPCDKCQTAINNFCARPDLVMVAKKLLLDRRQDMDNGIEGMYRRIGVLEGLRAGVTGVLDEIEARVESSRIGASDE